MKIFIYPLLIAVAPLALAMLLKLFKRKMVPKFPIFLIIILIIICGIVCTFASMIVSANGITESMPITQEPKCANGASLFFPIGIMSTVMGALINRKKPTNPATRI